MIPALKALRELCEAATPGPWKQHGMKWNGVMCEHYAKLTSGEAPSPDSKYSRPITVGYLQLEDTDYRPYDKDVQEELPMEANAAFIAASRQALPLLLDMVEVAVEALECVAMFGDESSKSKAVEALSRLEALASAGGERGKDNG